MSKRRTTVLVVLALFFAFVIADSMGVFDTKPHVAVPHGNHVHYVPKDCGPDLSIDRFPTTPPGPGERVDCSGRIVPITEP